MAPIASSRLYYYLSRHWLMALTVMCASFVLFGLLRRSRCEDRSPAR